MTSDQIYEISNLIIKLVVSVAGVTAVPFIVKKIGAENLNKYKSWAGIAAEAAEKMYQKYTGDDKSSLKKDYVVKFMTKMFGGKLTDEQIEALLESAALNIGSSFGTLMVGESDTDKNIENK